MDTRKKPLLSSSGSPCKIPAESNSCSAVEVSLLTQLSVRNFTLVKSLDIEFEKGMTAITGETGAGKSILLNALGLTLGDRADYGQIRQGEARAEVSASFDVSKAPNAQAFLAEQELDEDDECLLRRVINANGNSKAWINGQPVTLATLRALAEQLISIHSQHEHQRLTNREQQLLILDSYAGHKELCQQTATAYQEWIKVKRQLIELEQNQDKVIERLDLLRFQTSELEELSLKPGEFAQLEKEQHQLANAEDILKTLHQLSELVSESEDFNIVNASSQACQIAETISMPSEALSEAIELLGSARIQLEEARDSVRHAQASVEINPERLSEVEARISRAFELSRKHQVTADELVALQERLQVELDELESGGTNLDNLSEKASILEAAYIASALQLNESRRSYASTLSDEVNRYFEQLSMSGAELNIELTESEPNAQGGSEIEFLIRTNPGAPHKPLARVASGGELSRISLAIQVVTAQTSDSSTMVFDEVDVGIGGATASVVGDLLRKLGEHSQVICVTHLAQVASQAHAHMGVEKHSAPDHTETTITALNEQARIQEVARMIGGVQITEQSLAHADSLLRSGS